MADTSERKAAPDAKHYHKQHGGRRDNVATDAEEPAGGEEVQEARPASLRQKFERFVDWYNTHKKVSLPITAALAVVLFFAIPVTRYAALGLFLQQDFSVVVVDSLSGRPVSSAQVSLGDRSLSTDGEGKASLRVPVGPYRMTVEKAHYETTGQDVVVPVRKQQAPFSVKLVATGRPIPVTVLSSITGKPVAGATVTAENSTATTDSSGQATLVVPANPGPEVAATLSAEGYNSADITVKPVTEDDEANIFKLTPSGKIYFLSNQSGTIDVVKANLDGTDRQTVLAGTGKEARGETVLLATRDWRYLALLSKRDGGNDAKLFLIDTADGSVTNMDEGEANFTLVGWEGHRFLYTVDRYKMKEWEPKKQALKSYDADAKKLTTIDQTVAEGNNTYDYKREYLSTVYVVGGRAVYSKNWQGYYYSSLDKQATLVSVLPDGSDKKTVKTFDTTWAEARPYGADELYLIAQDKVFEYEDGTVTELPDKTSNDVYNAPYATYLASPDGKRTFWSQDRDGKLAFFVGDADAGNEQHIATLSTEYQVYGWYTDDYLIVSKKGSELYILSVAGVENEDQLLKITDYYKPYYTYPGYGGGYGGL